MTDESALNSFCALIGDDLRRLRHKKGMSQDAAAKAVGVSRQTLSRIEGGDMGVALGTVVALAQLYEAPKSFLRLMGVRRVNATPAASESEMSM